MTNECKNKKKCVCVNKKGVCAKKANKNGTPCP